MTAYAAGRRAERGCPFCGGPPGEIALVRPDALPLARCASCRCFHVAVRVEEGEAAAYYGSYWEEAHPRQLTAELGRYLASTAARRGAADPTLRRLGTLLGGWAGREVLDVGCGFGEKASAMQALGAAVTGVDLSPAAAAFAGGLPGLSVTCGTPEAVAPREGRFDLVTMLDFLEHPPDPLRAFGAAVAALRPGGLIAITTPNAAAGERALARGEVWEGFRHEPEHLQYLHPETVARLATGHGLRVVHLEQYGARSVSAPGADGRGAAGGPGRLVRRMLKGIPGVRPAVYAWRLRGGERIRAAQPARELGDYHLLAVAERVHGA